MITFKRESKFQADLKRELRDMFPGCIIFKCDPQQIQGTPDLLILYRDMWAALEVKKSETASKEPNQDYRVDYMNNMSFACFIYPENKEQVLDDLERFFEAR